MIFLCPKGMAQSPVLGSQGLHSSLLVHSCLGCGCRAGCRSKELPAGCHWPNLEGVIRALFRPNSPNMEPDREFPEDKNIISQVPSGGFHVCWEGILNLLENGSFPHEATNLLAFLQWKTDPVGIC